MQTFFAGKTSNFVILRLTSLPKCFPWSSREDSSACLRCEAVEVVWSRFQKAVALLLCFLRAAMAATLFEITGALVQCLVAACEACK